MGTLEWKQPIDIPDGSHTGQVMKVTERTEPYEYHDVWVSVDGQEGVELKYGSPSTLSPSSKLGRLLLAFGAKFQPGESLDPATMLVGKKCSYMTLKKSKDGKEFSEIVEDSLKPVGDGPREVATIQT